MPQNKSFMIGENSQHLNQLDPNFSYQNLSEFQILKGPSLDEIVSKLSHTRYEIENPKNNNYSPLNISHIIWDFLNSKPGKIRHSGSRPDYGINERVYTQKIINYVKRGMPIELFLMNFSPKFANPLVSGDNILPDLSNLLALQHLVDIGLSVREVYKPGIRFVVVYEGSIYQELGRFSDEEVQQTYQQVKYFNKLIEKKEGLGIVNIVDGKGLVKSLGAEFIDTLREEEDRLDKLYKNKKDTNFIYQLDEWRNKFALNIINLNKLINEGELNHKPLNINEWLQILNDSHPQDSSLKKVRELAYESTYKLAIDYFAFHNLKYSFGSENLGIMQGYPNAIHVTVRADKKRFALQLIPKTSMYPHHGITVWTGKKWEVTRLIDLARYTNQFVGIDLSGKGDVGRRPFYYLLKNANCPKFTKPIMPIEEVFPLILSKKGYHMLKDLSYKGTMDSRLFLAQDSSDKKVMIKYSSINGFQGNGRAVLQKEAKRLEEIVKILAPQRLFPEISEYHNDNNITYYVMNFFPDSRTVTDYLARLPDGKTYIEEAKKITNKLLTILSEEVYSKGGQKTPEKYLSIWHLDRLKQGIELLTNNQSNIFSSYIKDRELKVSNIKYKDLTEFFKKVFDYKTVRINGAEFLNFPYLLRVIDQNKEEINNRLNPVRVPLVTHGDLHFSNVLRNIHGNLHLVDPYGRRPINAVESELGRVTLSFFADFLRKKNYDINVHFGENSELEVAMYYNGDNEDLIFGMSKARDTMLNTIATHKGIYELIKDTEDWQSHVLLMEAIHIPVVAANKFAIDYSGKLTLGCYTVGTILMNNVLARMGFINPKYGTISSPMELFIPDGKYKFQRNQFIMKLAGNTIGTENTLNYITKSLKKVRKYG